MKYMQQTLPLVAFSGQKFQLGGYFPSVSLSTGHGHLSIVRQLGAWNEMYINADCKLMKPHWLDGCFSHCSRTMSNFHPHLILSRSSISALPHTKVSFAGVILSDPLLFASPGIPKSSSLASEALCYLALYLAYLDASFKSIHDFAFTDALRYPPSFSSYSTHTTPKVSFISLLLMGADSYVQPSLPPSFQARADSLIGAFHLYILHMPQGLCVKAHAAIFLYIPTPSEFWEKHPQAQSCQGQKPQIGSRILLPLIFLASESLRLIRKIFQIFHL